MTTSDRITILNLLGNLVYTRGAIILNNYPQPNSHTAYDSYVAAGKRVLCNFNWGQQNSGAIQFPTNMPLYRSIFNQVMNDIAAPELIVVENEEINSNYHLGTMAQYLNMLAEIKDDVHARGLKLTNGGIYGLGLNMLTYRYTRDHYDQATADFFGVRCMLNAGINAAKVYNSNPTFEALATKIDTLLAEYGGLLDFVNIHPYEPFDPRFTADQIAAQTVFTTDIVKRQKEYCEFRTGLRVITNETGVRNNTQGALITSILQNCVTLNMKYVIWYNGHGAAGAVPLNLTTSPFTLQDNGEKFKAFMNLYYAV